jgi:thiol-disulfide isomerase/thioredoxin
MKNLENKKVLDKYKAHWLTLTDAGYIANLLEGDVLELQKVYQEEVDANFFVNKWCNSCVAEMVQTLYLATKYDELSSVKKETSKSKK